MDKLGEMQLTETNLVALEVALNTVLLQEPPATIPAWEKTQLAWALRVTQDAATALQVEIAEAEVVDESPAQPCRIGELCNAARNAVGDVLDAKARAEQCPPRPSKDDQAE